MAAVVAVILRDLKYFVALAEELNLERAARRLAISRSSLTRQVKSLETEVGVRLFENDRRRVRLTVSGEALLTRGSDLLVAAGRRSESRQPSTEFLLVTAGYRAPRSGASRARRGRVALRVVLADESAFFRAAIRAMLDVSQGEVVRLVDTDRPDVVVADMITRELKVIVVSSRAKELYVRKALQSGALRYLLDDPSVVEVGLPLDSLARYEHPSPGAARTHVDAARAEIALTPRQREVLTLIARGRSTKEIALDLDLSVKTVETHRAQLMERLGIREVAGLVRYAIRRGLVPEE